MPARPIIAIIGRPNVGKSTLFNRLLKLRQAIVSPISGTTRDRQYAPVQIGSHWVDIVDTAGLSSDLTNLPFGQEMLAQVQEAVTEADILVFVLDAQAGLTHEDRQLAEIIRKAEAPTVVFVNKVDNPDMSVDHKMTHLGLGPTLTGSLAQRKGIQELRESLASEIQKIQKDSPAPTAFEEKQNRKVALIGRPNVGKSSILNTIIGYERAIVSDIPGTTRDTINTEVALDDGTRFTIIDTAGLRRRGKIGRAEKIEQYSVLRTLRAINQADIVLLIVDASEGLTRGDVHAAMHATEQKKRLITVFNKIDLVSPDQVNWRRFPFLSRLPMIFISTRQPETIAPLVELIGKELRTLDETPPQNSLEER